MRRLCLELHRPLSKILSHRYQDASLRGHALQRGMLLRPDYLPEAPFVVVRSLGRAPKELLLACLCKSMQSSWFKSARHRLLAVFAPPTGMVYISQSHGMQHVYDMPYPICCNRRHWKVPNLSKDSHTDFLLLSFLNYLCNTPPVLARHHCCKRYDYSGSKIIALLGLFRRCKKHLHETSLES